MKLFVIVALRGYRLIASPLMHALIGGGAGCRFYPTCSRYGEEAIDRHGILAGGALLVSRFLRCHPWSRGGYDPVGEFSWLQGVEARDHTRAAEAFCGEKRAEALVGSLRG